MAELNNLLRHQFEIWISWMIADGRPTDGTALQQVETSENRAQAETAASLAQQQVQLADQLAATRESARQQEAGPIAVAAATQEQGFQAGLQSSLQEFQATAATAAAKWLVFEAPEPPTPPGVPIQYSRRTLDWISWMIADGRPTDGAVH